MEGNSDIALVAFGNPLLDIIVPEDFSDGLIEKYDLYRNVAQELDTITSGLFDETTALPGSEIACGGCALNTVRVLQWLSGQAGRAAFCGGVGNDPEGRLIQSMLQSARVIPCLAHHDQLPTGHCVALVEGAERTLVANLGAANSYTMTSLETGGILNMLQTTQAIYVEGYFLAHSFDVTVELARFARANNKVFVFNLCGEYVCQDAEYVRNVAAILSHVNLLFGNRCEFQVFLKTAKSENIHHPLVQRLDSLVSGANKHASSQVIRKEAEGPPYANTLTAVLTEGGESVECHTFTAESALASFMCPVPPIPESEIKDTIGAGDSFIAGFLFCYLAGGSLRSSIRNAIWAAQEMMRVVGSSPPLHPPRAMPCLQEHRAHNIRSSRTLLTDEDDRHH